MSSDCWLNPGAFYPKLPLDHIERASSAISGDCDQRWGGSPMGPTFNNTRLV